VLIGGGVLTGMLALVIDVGQIYVERAQLQNGADAAALAVAKSCAGGPCAAAMAATYADANARDGVSAVDLVCGSGPLGICPAGIKKIYDCPPPPSPPPPPGGSGPPPPPPNYVDVHTSTETASGSTLLPPVFARTLLGNSKYTGTTVLACAQAVWGPPLTATTIAFTISACEWDKATSQGTVFAPPPPHPPNPPPAPALDQVLQLHTSASGGCPAEPAGADGAGGFGWTTDQTGTCSIAVTSSTYGENTGASAGQTCKQALANAVTSRAPLIVPVYVSMTGSGSTAVFTLKGFAAFVITGYQLPGMSASDWLNPANNCKSTSKCINGFFARALMPTTTPIGGPDLGAHEVKLSG
jgi:Flp pilus assembly protein TadG